jgi:hypothetical protein
MSRHHGKDQLRVQKNILKTIQILIFLFYFRVLLAGIKVLGLQGEIR